MKKQAKSRTKLWLGGFVFVVALIIIAAIYMLSVGLNKSADTPGATASISTSPSSGTHAVGEEFNVAIVINGGGQEYTGFSATVGLTNLTATAIAVIPDPEDINTSPSGDFASWTPGGKPTISKLSFSGAVKNSRTENITLYTLTVKANGAGSASINISNGVVNQVVNGTDLFNIIINPTSSGNYTIPYPNTPVTGVGTSKSNGYYGAGTVIGLTIQYADAVTVTGAPYLALNSGTGAKALYASGSGSTTLTFNYTVAAGDKTSRLNYSGSSALNLNGGSIIDSHSQATDNTLTVAGISLSSNIVIDTAKPLISDLSTANDEIYKKVYYTESVNVIDDSPLIYSWTSVGTNPIVFETPTAASPRMKTDNAGDSKIRVTITDQAGNTDYKELNISVHDVGDINGDVAVDSTDFNLLLNNWGTPTNHMADLNNDGKTDSLDFMILFVNWGKG